MKLRTRLCRDVFGCFVPYVEYEGADRLNNDTLGEEPTSRRCRRDEVSILFTL
jgi:hypothetical protein